MFQDVVDGDDGTVEQVTKQLYKLIDVVKVTNLTSQPTVIRELALIKVQCTAKDRRQVLDIVEIFRAQVVDVTPSSVIVQAVASGDRLDALGGLRSRRSRDCRRPADVR